MYVKCMKSKYFKFIYIRKPLVFVLAEQAVAASSKLIL